MSKLKLFVLTGFLAASLAPLYGCGSECGPGMTEEDGQCVVAAEGCGEGTVLSNKQCVVDDSGCGQGTILDGDVCVPDNSSCAEGTSFDTELSICVANTDIVCGEGTEADDSGVCVTSGEACSDKTSFDDNGRCVVTAASCGAGTDLDPNSGECVLAAAACGEGLALDAQTGACVPTEGVCDSGTRFEADSGLCLPDACQEGDVLIDGICMNPAEELAHDPDLTETENNDPSLGGTAETLALGGVDEGVFTFVGTITEPVDLDGDSRLDQDVDTFSFDAGEGDWIELMVQSTGLPAPAFKVEGPGGFLRYSQLVGARDVARQIVVPETGTYTVSVLPSHAIEDGEGFAPSGSDAWSYVGSANTVSAPAPTDADISSGSTQLTGELLDLSDNLFELTGLSADDTLTLTADTVGRDAQAAVQIWANSTTLHTTRTIDAGQSIALNVPSSGSAKVLVDWIRADGSRVDFAVTAAITGSQTNVTIADGATESLTVDAQALDRITASQTNPSGERLDVAIRHPDGELIVGRRLDPYEELPVVAFEPGAFTVELSNNTGASVDATLMANITPPHDFGQIPEGGNVTSPSMQLPKEGRAYFRFSASAGQVLSFTHENTGGEKAHMTVYDTAGEEVLSDSSIDPVSSDDFLWSDHFWEHLQNDETWIVEVEAVEQLNDFHLNIDSIDPQLEGTVTEASPLTISSSTPTPKGLSGFHLVEFAEPLGFYGTVTPDAGQDIDFYIYDLQDDELLKQTGIDGGTKTFGGQLDAGTYLLRAKCDDACNSYEIEINGYSSTIDLGTVAAGNTVTSGVIPVFNEDQTLTLDFNVAAGSVIEITHDNLEGDDHDAVLKDASGAEVADDSFFYAVSQSSSSAPDVMYHYSESGGDFSFLLESRDDNTDEEITIRVLEPRDLGGISLGESVSDSVSTTLTKHKRFFHKVTLNDTVAFGGAVIPAGGENVDVHMYDAQFNEVDSWSSGSGDRAFGDVIDSAGTYIFATECEDNQCTDFDFSVSLTTAQDDLGSLTPDSTTNHSVGDLYYYQPKTLTFSVPAGQLIAISHDNDQAQYHRFRLYDGDGNSLVYESSFYPTSADAEYIYWYTREGGEFTLEMEGRHVATNEVVTIDLSTPPNEGTLDTSGTPLTFSSTDTCVAGESLFHIVDFAEAMTFGGTLTPTNAENLDFYMSTLDNEELYDYDSGSGEISFQGVTARYPGEYLVQVECGESAAGYDLTLENATSIEEDLGDLGADNSVSGTDISNFNDGDQKVYTFSVDAGQIIEVSHDNAEGESQDVYLYDANGVELEGDSNMYPRIGNSYGVEYMYAYAENGGDFSVYLLGDNDATAQSLTVRAYTPNEVTMVMDGTESVSMSSPLDDSQRDYHLVTLAEDGLFEVKGSSGNPEDIDLYIFDTNMNRLEYSTSSGGINTSDELSAGTYLVAIEPDGAVPSYSATFGLSAITSSP